MKKIIIDELCEICRKLNGKPVNISVIGTVRCPYFFDNFEFVDMGNEICFGEKTNENFSFSVYKDIIKDVAKEEDLFSENDVYVRFMMQVDIFTDFIEIQYEN